MDHSEYKRELQILDQQLNKLMSKRAELTQDMALEVGYEKLNRNQFEMVDKLPTEGARIVFQGVEGAYSHQAMQLFFGKDADAYNVATFEQAVAAVENGDADYAVLPVENTTGGAVGDVLDLQMKYHCYSVALLDLPIQHMLLGVPGAKISDITEVYSHPQALAQCSEFLEQYPQWTRVPFSNTATSAKKVMEDGMVHRAAIASSASGELYGLVPLAKNIATNKYNTTRFIIATGKRIFSKNATKVSICFEAQHVSGTLYRLLSHIIYNGLNMTRIESRPVPGRNFEYRFYVDFEGNLQDSMVQSALYSITKEAKICRVLGNMIEDLS